MLWSELITIAVCMTGAAFYAGIETGMISIPRMHLRHRAQEGSPAARVLEDFLDHPDRLLGTTLVGTNLCIVMASVLASSLGHRLLSRWGAGATGQAIAGVVMTGLILIFCEYLPKAWFQSRALTRCSLFAGLLQQSARILHPFAAAFNWLTQWLIPGAIIEQAPQPLFATKEELDLLAREGAAHGALSDRQRIMIRRVLDLSMKTARDIMTPRDRIRYVQATNTVAEFLQTARQVPFTRFPVFNEERGTFEGTVNLFDVLARESPDAAARVTQWLRPPLFVPDSTPVTEILPRLRLSRQPLCLVTDARGNVVGLVTAEDILANIVGKL